MRPLEPRWKPEETNLYGEKMKGRELFDAVDRYVRAAFSDTDPAAQRKELTCYGICGWVSVRRYLQKAKWQRLSFT